MKLFISVKFGIVAYLKVSIIVMLFVKFYLLFSYFLFIKFILINILLFLGNNSLFFFNEDLLLVLF